MNARRIARLVDDPRCAPAVRAWRAARLLRMAHASLTRRALDTLAFTGTDPGPLISGIVSERLPERTKRRLRRLAHAASRFKDRAYAARPSRMRMHTFRAVLRAAVGGDQ